MNTDTGKVYNGEEEVEAARARGERLVELPWKPTPGCHVCKGEGTKKSWGTAYKFGACPKCYPDHEQRAAPFSAYLALIKQRR